MRLLRPTILYAALFLSLFVLLRWFNAPGDYVAGATTAAVGYVAYFVYAQGKNAELEDAARIIILDIRNAEDAVGGVRLHGTRESWLKIVSFENSWVKYKHLLVSELDTDEFKAFDTFFHNWMGLTKAQIDATNYQTSAVIGKSNEASRKLIELKREDPDFSQKHKSIVDTVNLDTWLFQPDMITGRATVFLNSIQNISGTTGFAKIRKIAGLTH